MLSEERNIPEEWSFEAGLRALEDVTSSEARILDSMTLLSTFYSDREDEVVRSLAAMLRDGRTLEIRRRAALNLSLMLSSAASSAIREALPELDEETRRSAESILRTNSGRTVSFLGSFGKDDERRLRGRLDAGMLRLGEKAEKRHAKLVKSLLGDEFRGDCLARSPSATPALAVGGIGFRAEFVPLNPRAAKFVVWVGAQGVRCAVGEREACITKEIGTRLGWRFWTLGVGSYADSVRAGDVVEYVSPEQDRSLVLLPLAGKQVEELRSSTAVPRLDKLPETWTKLEYEAFEA